MNNKINIILDGKHIQGEKGETILELARKHKIEIPTLCNDPRLKPYSSCFVCVVEVEGMRGLQPSCSTRINDGMNIQTKNKKVRNARKTALELLLSNHYADCEAPCKQTCPAGVDVQGYISLIEKRQYSEAVALIKEVNPLPAICGRVCVRPCEVACRRNLMGEGAAVGIDYLKRFASDFDINSPLRFTPELKPSTGKEIAVIGAGPGGLSCAYFLQKEGHKVDLYEANPKAGGMLRYGIPEYRLPNDLLQKEIDTITEMGARIFFNKKFGENLSYKELSRNYDAVILTIGSQKGTLVGCKGDDAKNVFPGIDFLRNMEITGQQLDFSGKKVVVIGGGNTAMDCCRTSVRCGAEKTYIVYRRTEKEMPANPIEIHESKLEGVEYLILTNPVEVIKDEEGKVKSMICMKMQLGEPDSSGRRRPMPVEGSEFELEVDYVLAAIGQKTNVDFLDEINNNSTEGELKINRWGNIDADEKTLQTGVPSIFAAGDGVTGAATLIEAIAQAKIAAHSCNQYLSGQVVSGPKSEFISKKENFKKLTQDEFVDKYEKLPRKEMPILPPDKRNNFTEVELGYNEEHAIDETRRCLECGCTEFYTCDLKKYSTEYDVSQKSYTGEYNEFDIEFSHPYIEIDNNKCILCSRCIRICSEVVGANALGLVNRGFDTYVAPAMGFSLTDTRCESCGLCISACPTGAMIENFQFKPGPVKLESMKTICNYCSVGCEISLNHHNGFIFNVTGSNGLINKDANICKYAKFGYQYLNDNSRILKPLIKKGKKFVEISFEEAFSLIAKKIKSVDPDKNAFYAGARLSNEEMYLIQKTARVAGRTNNINNFYYLFGGQGYINNSENNVPFDQIRKAGKIYLVGSEINMDNAVVGFMVNNAKETQQIPVSLITTNKKSKMAHKVSNVTIINSYYNFIKAVNYYLLANGMENSLFIKDNCSGFETYKKKLLNEDFDALVDSSGINCRGKVISFAREFNNEMNAIIIFSEKEISSATSYELHNLALITGKLGKTASGLISLKEKNNAQGLFDMGICQSLGVGGRSMNGLEYRKYLKEKWDVKDLPVSNEIPHHEVLNEGEIKNMFIFGEDPVGCAINTELVNKWLNNTEFLVVQDYFMTETAKKADLILPASLPIEINGSFTNTQKVIQEFEQQITSKIEFSSIQQLLELLNKFGSDKLKDIHDVKSEIASLLSISLEKENHSFTTTDIDNYNRIFNYGCDYIVKKFNTEFNERMN
ncbi:MAG: FAD-dependent oxidoreductase [Chlorobi bacterium]|nr:FAD-dependent oxidoreductase [Chlorobiota bacterium]